MKKQVKKVIMAALISGSVLATSSVAFAGSAYNKGSGYAGSVGVTGEVGFNGTSVYATVTATDYVDAYVEDGKAYYVGANGSLTHKDFSGTLSYITYGQVTTKCDNNVKIVSCTFEISSWDGDWEFYGYAY